MIWHPNHPICDGGCGELADECACMRPNPLGSMRTEPGIGSIAERGLANVRAAMQVAPRTRRDRDQDTNPTRAAAIARARTERTNAKEATP